MSSRSGSSYSLVSLSYAPTTYSTYSLILNIPCWLGVMGTQGKGLFKNSCLWDSNKDQAASGTPKKLIVRFSLRSFTPKSTESRLKSEIHCVPLLETVNCIVLTVTERVVSWRRVCKMKKKVNFCCNKTDSRSVTRLFHMKWYLCLFWNKFNISFLCFCRGEFWLADVLMHYRREILFLVIGLCLFSKAVPK